MKKNKKLSPIRVNRVLQARYKRLINQYADFVNSLSVDIVLPAYERVGVAVLRNDNIDDLNNAFNRYKSLADDAAEKVKPYMQKIFEEMTFFHGRKFSDSLKKKIGVDILPAFGAARTQRIAELQLTTDQNLSLIKSMSDSQLDRIKNIVYQDLRTGQVNIGKVRETMIKDFGMTKRKANFIARDQTHKFVSNLTKISSESIGADKYVWHNAGDRRVRGNPSGLYPDARHDHWAREGEIFYYARPPAGGNPGQDYNCRCYAEVVLPDNLEELSRNYG